MTEVFYFQCYMAITVAFRDGGWCMSVFCLLNVEYAVFELFSTIDSRECFYLNTNYHQLPLIYGYYMIIHVMI